MSFVNQEYQQISSQNENSMIKASRRHQKNLSSRRQNSLGAVAQREAGRISARGAVRAIPKLKNGVQDEWKALIDLQDQADKRAAQAKREVDVQRKKTYLVQLQNEIDQKQIDRRQEKQQRNSEAVQMMDAQKRKDEALEKRERQEQAAKRNQLKDMNLQQIGEYRKQKLQKVKEENAFALASHADAELKEKSDRENQVMKQKKYLGDLQNEIRKKDEMKKAQQHESLKIREQDVQNIKDQIEKENRDREVQKAKFNDFSIKYDKKNEWYQKNIIQPQIEKHLEDFDREINYNEKYNHKQISKEKNDEYHKRLQEQKVFRDVELQIKQKNDQKELIRQLKQEENEQNKQIAKDDEMKTKREQDAHRAERQRYRKNIDEQIDRNARMKAKSMMSQQEMALNKQDLERFKEGYDEVSTMILGLQKPQKDSSMSNYSNPNLNREKQKRLQQFGYNQQVLSKSSLGNYESPSREPLGSARRSMMAPRDDYASVAPTLKSGVAQASAKQMMSQNRGTMSGRQMINMGQAPNSSRSQNPMPGADKRHHTVQSPAKTPNIMNITKKLPINSPRYQQPDFEVKVNKFSGAAGARSGVLKNAANSIFC